MKKKSFIILGILAVLVIGVLVYLNTYYKALNVEDYLKSNDIIDVKKIKNGYFFDGPGEDKAFIFYPGAKVEYTSYAALMSKLAEEGIDASLVEMPFNIAFLGSDRADKIMNGFEYGEWYMGGHSLGGVVVANYVSENDNIKGLILLASYATREIDVKTLSLYGNEDGVLNMKNYDKNKDNLKDLTEIVIDGGNHAGFGNYGKQKGDRESKISSEEQQSITAKEIVKFINNN